MKSLPIVQCQQCRRFLEFGREDLVERRWNFRYDVNCSCKTFVTVPLELVHEHGWHEKEEAPPPPKQEEKPPAKKSPSREMMEKAVQTFAAVQKYGSKAAAARELGVSVTTVNNRLSILPENYGETSAE